MTWLSRRDVIAAWMLWFAPDAMAERTPWPPYLSFFVDEQDARTSLDRLNSDVDIAFIVHDGPRWHETPDASPGSGWVIGRGNPTHRQRWRAVRDLERFEVDHLAGETVSANHTLWFLPAGPLPWIPAGTLEPNGTTDPWAGWTEEALPLSEDKPNFGYNFPGTIQLELRTETHRPFYLSKLEWDSNYPPVYQWSRQFQEWLSRVAVPLRVPRYAPDVVWVFPSALQRLKGGLPYYARGMELDQAIRTAPNMPVPK